MGVVAGAVADCRELREATACCLTYAWHPPNTRHQSPYQPGSPLPPLPPIHDDPPPLPSTATTHSSTTAYTSKMSATQKVQQHPAFIQAQDKANYYVNQLDKELSKYPALNAFEQRTQVPKSYAFLGAVVLLAVLHSVNAFASPVSNLVGWALPAYLSVKALESPGHADDVQWLTYWIVFGFFNFLESFALRAVLYYFPWYFAFKSVFILWLQLPQFRGAQTLYGGVVRPVFANISSNGSRLAPTQSEPTVTADGLRERVDGAQ